MNKHLVRIALLVDNRDKIKQHINDELKKFESEIEDVVGTKIKIVGEYEPFTGKLLRVKRFRVFPIDANKSIHERKPKDPVCKIFYYGTVLKKDGSESKHKSSTVRLISLDGKEIK